MRTPILVVLALCSLLGVHGGPVAVAEGPSLNDRVSTFKKLIRSKDPKARGRAFEILRGCTDPAVIDQLTWGIDQVRREEASIHKAQKKAEAGFEKFFDKLEAAKQKFEASARSSRDMERFNKTADKIAREMDASTKELKNLENDITRNRAMISQAVLVAGEILASLEGEVFEDALARITIQWLHDKDMANRLNWFAAVEGVDTPSVANALHGVAGNGELETTLRVRAVDALALRRDGMMFGKAMAMLKLPRAEQPMILAAIRFLRSMHDQRGIEPLIGFLERDDLKRARTDAQQALTSLTGVDHGPYAGQWKKWWEDNQKTFTMPKDPRPSGTVVKADKGKTFYGITTLSDKILFILDISKSMDKTDTQGGKSRMEVLKQELLGSVYNLNPKDTFNVVLFNHQVIPWQRRKVEASEGNKKMLEGWVKAQEPLGGTNIHDALELGFQIAHQVTGPAALDTVFFLTDGKPTAGKIRDPAKMLAIFREWNQTAHLTIHTIGIGKDHDATFLKELAKIGDGSYIAR